MFLVVVNITTNRTELVEEPWSRVEKSVIVVILSIEMVLGILGNSLVLIVKIVVRTAFILLKCLYYFQSDLRGAITDNSHYYGITIQSSRYKLCIVCMLHSVCTEKDEYSNL